MQIVFLLIYIWDDILLSWDFGLTYVYQQLMYLPE